MLTANRFLSDVQARNQTQITGFVGDRITPGSMTTGVQSTPFPNYNATSTSAMNDTVTTPLALPPAPPSYTEAMDTAYDPQLSAPMVLDEVREFSN